MITKVNPYEVLSLDEDASYEDIKERYRQLVRTLHPDKQPLEKREVAKRFFAQIDQAYKAISSPYRRYIFAEYGSIGLQLIEE